VNHCAAVEPTLSEAMKVASTVARFPVVPGRTSVRPFSMLSGGSDPPLESEESELQSILFYGKYV